MSFLPILRDADIFYNLDSEQLERIVAICTQATWPKGTVVFMENRPGEELCIVASGLVEIQVDPAILGQDTDVGPSTIAVLRQGQVFGEVVLVDRGLRSASVRIAADDTVLLVMQRSELIALCEQDYELGYKLMYNIAADLAFKIRGADLRVREQLLWRPSSSREDP